jgi:predicted Zn finger-like uncharacterized protein
MRIVCPICAATYEVRDALLAPGRTVRCARCGDEWVAVATPPPPQEDLPEEPPRRRRATPAPPPPLTAMERLASAPAAPPRAATGLRLAWAASLALLLLCGVALFVWRAELMHVWPPIARLYRWLGLAAAAGP